MLTNLPRSMGNHMAAVLDSFYNSELFYKVFNFGKVILRNLNWFKIKKITEEQIWGEVTLSKELVLGRIRDS